MKNRKSIINYLSFLALVIFVGIAACGDTIKLKDGSVLKGKVVAYSQGKFTIIVYIGGNPSRHVLSIDEIESVEFDPTTDLASASRDSGQGGGGQNASPAPATDSAGAAHSETSKVDPAPANDQPTAAAGGAAVVVAEKSIDVAAAADWTSTGIRVQRGQRIAVEASGEIGLGGNRKCGPDGLGLADQRKLIPNRPTGALIAVVGDDNDDFVYLGGTGEFVSTHNGVLFLSVNEGNLKDNSGSFSAHVKVMSGK